MRFVLFVEGHTEQACVGAFLKRWLDSQLSQRIGIKPVRFDGWPQLVRDAPTKTRLYLDAPNSDVIAVLSMIDLYGPTFFPSNLNTVADKVAWGKAHIENAVNHNRFHQYFAVHETEAWLLSQPGLFGADIQQRLPASIAQPETINCHEPPAKLLDRVYMATRKKHYKKVTDGKALFARLDPAAAYRDCPVLREMLDHMLTLAKQAGL